MYRSVSELVDDCFPILHREPLERVVSERFARTPEVRLGNLKIELVHNNYARLSGTYTMEVVESRNQRVMRDIPVVAEALWDFSPRTWGFRLDIVHMHAETDDPAFGDRVVAEVLAAWQHLPALGRFRYRRGVFYATLDPVPELASVAVS
ncbi:MAG: hypothetical protein FJZ01_08880 [Candidatus Sericytochromatia bacterium]|nr:hypothetical protein [Candidatus Tanganyikabacteria bacterium]